MKTIARYHGGFKSKFGVPRQSGLVPEIKGTLVFEPEYRVREAFRGLDNFSHIWLVWGFSDVAGQGWRPTVRPPRLGGNTRLGVFATRSPFRPNPIGLSCVKLDEIVFERERGPVLHVSGGDLTDGTPIYDVKPYLPLADRIETATGALPNAPAGDLLSVEIPDALLAAIPESDREALRAILAGDPRPAYQDDPGRIYGFEYGGTAIKFSVADGVLKVTAVES